MSISPMLLPGELLPDTEWGLVAKAFEKNYSIIASYSAIPASTHVSLEIQEHGEAPGAPGLGRMGGVPPPPDSAPPSLWPAEAIRRAPATPTPPAPTANSLPHMLLFMLRPWKCTDETMEIVIARSHLEVRGVGGGGLMPTSITRGGCILLGVGGTGVSPASE